MLQYAELAKWWEMKIFENEEFRFDYTALTDLRRRFWYQFDEEELAEYAGYIGINLDVEYIEKTGQTMKKRESGKKSKSGKKAKKKRKRKRGQK